MMLCNWTAYGLGVLQSQLLDDQFRVARVRLVRVTILLHGDDAVQDIHLLFVSIFTSNQVGADRDLLLKTSPSHFKYS